ncbi:MAG: hypothetical protein ABSF28_06110 [Terracidiphilus sp.]
MTIRLIVMEFGRFMGIALARNHVSGAAPLLHCEFDPRPAPRFPPPFSARLAPNTMV